MFISINEMVDYCYELIKINHGVIDNLKEININGIHVEINEHVITILDYCDKIIKIPYGEYNVCEMEEQILDVATTQDLEQWFAQIIGKKTTPSGNEYFLYEKTEKIDFGNIYLRQDTAREIQNDMMRITNSDALWRADARLLMILFQEFGVRELREIDEFLESGDITNMELQNWGYSKMNKRYVLTSYYHKI